MITKYCWFHRWSFHSYVILFVLLVLLKDFAQCWYLKEFPWSGNIAQSFFKMQKYFPWEFDVELKVCSLCIMYRLKTQRPLLSAFILEALWGTNVKGSNTFWSDKSTGIKRTSDISDKKGLTMANKEMTEITCF